MEELSNSSSRLSAHALEALNIISDHPKISQKEAKDMYSLLMEDLRNSSSPLAARALQALNAAIDLLPVSSTYSFAEPYDE